MTSNSLVDQGMPAFRVRSEAELAEMATAFRKRMHGVAAKGIPGALHDKLLRIAHAKSHELLYQDTSVVAVNQNKQPCIWTYYKEKNGVLLCQGVSPSGDYMVKASVNASSRVGPLASMLNMDTADKFQETLSKIGKPWYENGDIFMSMRDPACNELHVNWLAWGTEGAELHDFIYMRMTKVYDSQRRELPGSCLENAENGMAVEYMTQVWDSVDMFPHPYPQAARVQLKNSGFLIERTHDQDVSRVSFVLCVDRNRKREKWMERMAFTLVHEIAVGCRDAHVTVASKQEFGSEPHCSTCLKTFGVFRRRHHCRLCTGAICNVCSTTVMVGSADRKSIRACLPCSTSSNESTLTRRNIISARKNSRSTSEQYYNLTSTQRDLRDTHRSHEASHIPSERSSSRVSRSSNRSGRMQDEMTIMKIPPIPPSTQTASSQMPKRSFRSSTTTTISSQELSPPTHEFSKFYVTDELKQPHLNRQVSRGSSRDTNPLVEEFAWVAEPVAPAHNPSSTAFVFDSSTKECRPDPWRRTEPKSAFVEEELDHFDLHSGIHSPRNDLIPLPKDFGKSLKRSVFPSSPQNQHDGGVRPSLISVCSDYEF